MSFSCGFVGLPNVGKSTLFNALCKGGAEAANFPFCTIEPNTGIVGVPDERLEVLAKMEKSGRIVQSTLKFIDIAGLVKGASQGQGLGNQFLGHIRSVDAVAHVVRVFGDPDVVHVEGVIDPAGDLEVILTELMLADLEMLEKRRDKTFKAARAGDPELKFELELIKSFIEDLNSGQLPRYDASDAKTLTAVKKFELLCTMPAFVCANCDEENFKNFDSDPICQKLRESAARHGMEVIPVCAKLEEELSQLPPEEARMFLDDYGVGETGLARVIRTGYKLLNYITFFTAGEMESRAWTCVRGTPAPEAVGVIHTDFTKSFIRMLTVSYSDMVSCGGWNKAKEAGKLRTEGKEYIMQDGDVIHVLHNA